MSRTGPVALRGVLLLAVPAAHADEGADLLKERFRESIENGLVKEAVKYLLELPYAAELLAPAPKQLNEVCRTASDHAANIGRTPEDAERLGAFLLEVVEQCDSKDADARAARGETHLYLARLKVALRKAGAAGELELSATAFEEAYDAAEGDGQPLARAVDALLEMAAVSPERREDALGRAGKIAVTLESKHKGSPAAALARAALDGDAVRADVAAKRPPKEIAARVQAALDRLLPHVAGAAPDLRLVTAYNEIVTIARRSDGIPVRTEYLLARSSTPGGELEYAHPRSLNWRCGIGKSGSIGTLLQYAPSGELRREIDFYRYRWDTEYTFGAQVVGGDNVKGIATFDIGHAAIAKVTEPHRVTKGRLNRQIANGYVAEVTGVDKDGEPVRVRSYYIRCKGRMLTLNVRVLERGDLGPDPEAEAFLESLAEG